MCKHAFAKSSPKSLQQATIKVIFKENKDPEAPVSYWPVSIPNTDRKMLTKMLAARLHLLIPKIV